jgi:predicted CopG family antitoxin
MTDTTSFTSSGEDRFSTGREGWLKRSENWLDARGKFAWIAAMVLGFIFFWPVGLALLGYMIWSKRMFSSSTRCTKRSASFAMTRPSGNTAFDAYKADTLRRLQEEQDSFESFLERLRAAKDKSEFDAFMDERASRKDDAAEG